MQAVSSFRVPAEGCKLLDGFFESRRVRHQVFHGDGLVERRRNLEVEIVVHAAVEVDLALLGELHHGRPGEGLGNRPRPEQRVADGDRLSAFHVRVG
jgi:hypothetical protein